MDTTKNAVAYFEIHSSNPERDIRFYQSVFAWEFVREDSPKVEYYRITKNTVQGGLLKRSAPLATEATEPNAFVSSVQVVDFDETSEHIVQRGGRITIAKFRIPGRCWQGYFTDPDGNAFGIFQVDENAG